MDALNPFSSKLMTLTTGGGSGTFSAKLALCVAWHEEGGLKKRPLPFNEANKKETLTVNGDVDCLSDGRANPVLCRAGVRSLSRLVHGGDEQRSVGKLIVGKA